MLNAGMEVGGTNSCLLLRTSFHPSKGILVSMHRTALTTASESFIMFIMFIMFITISSVLNGLGSLHNQMSCDVM